MNASVLGYLRRVLAPSAYYVPVLDAPGLIGPLWLILSRRHRNREAWRSAATDVGERAVDRAFGLLPSRCLADLAARLDLLLVVRTRPDGGGSGLVVGAGFPAGTPAGLDRGTLAPGAAHWPRCPG